MEFKAVKLLLKTAVVKARFCGIGFIVERESQRRRPKVN